MNKNNQHYKESHCIAGKINAQLLGIAVQQSRYWNAAQRITNCLRKSSLEAGILTSVEQEEGHSEPQ